MKVGQYAFSFCLDPFSSIQGHILVSLMTHLYRKRRRLLQKFESYIKIKICTYSLLYYYMDFLDTLQWVRVPQFFIFFPCLTFFVIILESGFHRHNLNYFKKRVIWRSRKPQVENNVFFLIFNFLQEIYL